MANEIIKQLMCEFNLTIEQIAVIAMVPASALTAVASKPFCSC